MFEGVVSSVNCVTHSGWRLKFPVDFSTAPAIGRSHWSQMIRMLVLLKIRTKEVRVICVITSCATTDILGNRGFGLLLMVFEMVVSQTDKSF